MPARPSAHAPSLGTVPPQAVRPTGVGAPLSATSGSGATKTACARWASPTRKRCGASPWQAAVGYVHMAAADRRRSCLRPLLAAPCPPSQQPHSSSRSPKSRTRSRCGRACRSGRRAAARRRKSLRMTRCACVVQQGQMLLGGAWQAIAAGLVQSRMSYSQRLTHKGILRVQPPRSYGRSTFSQRPHSAPALHYPLTAMPPFPHATSGQRVQQEDVGGPAAAGPGVSSGLPNGL